MKKFFYLAVASLAVLAQPVFAATYTTTRGSILEMEVAGDHSVTGFFTAGIGSDCTRNVRTPIVDGTSVDNNVNFTVHYNCEQQGRNNVDVTFGGVISGSTLTITSLHTQRSSFAVSEEALSL